MEAGGEPAQLTLGPLLYHWDAEKRRDFYFRIADEAPVDTVYLGEVVCSKREPTSSSSSVAARLRTAGKHVVVSTLALVTIGARGRDDPGSRQRDAMVEANDVACLQLLPGKPHVIGPFINVFNEGAREFLVRRGAVRIVLPVEAPAPSIRVWPTTPRRNRGQVFGRQPLSVAMRCYHARAHASPKDHCQFVCGLDRTG